MIPTNRRAISGMISTTHKGTASIVLMKLALANDSVGGYILLNIMNTVANMAKIISHPNKSPVTVFAYWNKPVSPYEMLVKLYIFIPHA